MTKRTLFLLLGGLMAFSIAMAPSVRGKIERRRAVREAERLLSRPLPAPAVPLPPASDDSASFTSSVPDRSPEDALPPEVNLPVPFTVQAPAGDWHLPYQEACEEAAALMVIRFVFGEPFLGTEDADAGIRELVRTNADLLGLPVDQTAEEVRRLIHAIDPKIPVALVERPSILLLRRQLALGNVIIVPAAGRKLGNPFYRSPGPLYHMLVLRGYTADGYFITNDPGTKRGEAYLYPFERIMEAMGDWNGGDPANGEKVVLVLKKMEN